MTAGLQRSDLIISRSPSTPWRARPRLAMNLHASIAALTADKAGARSSPGDAAPRRDHHAYAFASRGAHRPDQGADQPSSDDEDWARLSLTMGLLLEKGKMYIDDASRPGPDRRALPCPAHRPRARRSRMIMIDYLQLMRVPALSGQRTLRIGEISRSSRPWRRAAMPWWRSPS